MTDDLINPNKSIFYAERGNFRGFSVKNHVILNSGQFQDAWRKTRFG